MAVSKIIYGGKTLIDLTQDSVSADKLLKGYSAHGADGNPITGTCTWDADTSDATATAAEILSGKTAYKGGTKVTGSMPNNGGKSLKITSRNTPVNIPKGYHDGSGTASIDDTEKNKLVPENIREGVTILGVEGNMTGTEGASPQAVSVTPATTVQVIVPDTNSGYNYISQVTVEAIPYVETDNSAGGKTVTIG